MIITNARWVPVLPEPGDVFRVVIGQGPESKLVSVRAERVEDADDCTGCVFEEMCKDRNTTNFLCYGPDRHDGISVKMVPCDMRDII